MQLDAEFVEWLSNLPDNRPADGSRAWIQSPEARLLNEHGAELTGRGEFKAALHAFDKALRLNPQFAIAYSNRGFVYLRLERLESAARDFGQTLRWNPELAIAHHNFGLLHATQGDYRAALAEKRCQEPL